MYPKKYTYITGQGLTSLMVSIRGVCGPIEQWQCGGIPLTMMMCIERRKGYVSACVHGAVGVHAYTHISSTLLHTHIHIHTYIHIQINPSPPLPTTTQQEGQAGDPQGLGGAGGDALPGPPAPPPGVSSFCVPACLPAGLWAGVRLMYEYTSVSVSVSVCLGGGA